MIYWENLVEIVLISLMIKPKSARRNGDLPARLPRRTAALKAAATAS